ncbi:MAG: GntR family transcriptional regulator [Methylococcales bacterium]
MNNKSIIAQRIYGELRSMILDFKIHPNSRLTETELANYFKVSRTPIREALKRLETEGLVTIKSKQGCFVRPIDLDELTEYYEIRISLEMLSLDTACAKMPDREIKRLCDIWEHKPDHISNVETEQIANLDEAFHIALAKGGGNQSLVKILRDINNRIRIVRRLDFTDEERIEKTYSEHFEILKRLLERDLKGAKNKMMRHIRKSEEFTKNLTLIQLGVRRNRIFPAADDVDT